MCLEWEQQAASLPSQVPSIIWHISLFISFIKGKRFGRDPSAIQVSIDGSPCSNVSIVVPDSKISCMVRPGSGIHHKVTVSLQNTKAVAEGNFSYLGMLNSI